MPLRHRAHGESWTERRYRRMGGAYLWLSPAAISLNAVVNVGIGAIAGVLLLEIPASEWTPIFLRGMATFAVWIVAYIVWGQALMRPTVDWVRGKRDVTSAPAVWRNLALDFWRVLVLGIVTFSVAAIPLILYVNRVAGLPRYGTLLIGVGMQILIAGVAFVNYFLYEALARPILRDVSRLLPPDFEIPRRGPRLALKVLGASVVIPAYGGILLIAATGQVEGPLALLGVGIAILAFVTITLSLPLSALLARSVVSPVEALVRASQEVRAGELGTRVPITSADEIGELSQSFNEMVAGLRERHSLQAAMGAYVDPVIAERILVEGHILEGEETDVTVMFLDVRDFTTRSERMTPQEVVTYLNGLFAAVVPIIARHGGHVNKFLGDGLLAVFGTPEPMPDHAARAVDAARKIVLAMSTLDGDGTPTRIGIGLHSGPVIAGTIGSGPHVEFGLIGDTVNVAARIEQHTKETGDAILVSEETRRRVRGLRAASRGQVTLRGREYPVRIHAIATPSARRPLTRRRRARLPQS